MCPHIGPQRNSSVLQPGTLPRADEYPQACSGWVISVYSALVPPLPWPQATIADLFVCPHLCFEALSADSSSYHIPSALEGL